MQLFANNAKTTLASAIGPSTLSLQVATGEGAMFPSPTAGDFFKITLFGQAGDEDTDIEIITITARTGDTMTIGARAQEGTAAIAHGVGQYAELRDTAGWHGDVVTALAGAEAVARKNAANGYAGLAANYAIQVKSAGGTITSTLTSAATTPRVITLPDKNGTLATLTDITGTNSGTNTGDQVFTLTGDVTGTGTGTFAATIAAGAVTLAKMANLATATLIGRNSAGTGVPEALSAATAKTLLVLNNVDNTSDANKPVSTAQLSALNLKADKSDTYTKSQVDGLVSNSGYATGDVRYVSSGVTLSQPDWLPMRGGIFSKAAYPAAYAVAGPGLNLADAAAVTAPVASTIITDSAWTPDSSYLAVTVGATPYMGWYKKTGETLTKLTNPATLPAGAANTCAWSPDGVYLAIGHTTTPFLSIYKRSGDTLTKLTTPTPAAAVGSLVWSNDGGYLFFGYVASAGIFRAVRTGDTFAGFAATVDDAPNGVVRDLDFSTDGTILIAGQNNTSGRNHSVYAYDSGSLTRIADLPLANVPARSITYLSMSANDTLAVGTTSGLALYQRSGSSFSSIPIDSNYLSDVTTDIDWTPDGAYLWVANNGGGYAPGITALMLTGGSARRYIPTGTYTALPTAASKISVSPDGLLTVTSIATTPLRAYGRGYDTATQFTLPAIYVDARVSAYMKS